MHCGGGHTLGNVVEAGKCTVPGKTSQERHMGFYREVIGDKMECVSVGIYPFGKKEKEKQNQKSKESNSTIAYWMNR